MYSCPICGENAMEEVAGTFRMDPPDNIPGGTIEVPNTTWEKCEACGEQILSPELEEQIEEVRFQRLGLLRPDEIRAVRERAGLSQTLMAQFVGVGEKTYNRWESGRSLQNKSSDNLIRIADEFPELFAHLEARRHPDREKRIEAYFQSLLENKGQNELAFAAHGADVNLSILEELRKRLLLLADTQAEE